MFRRATVALPCFSIVLFGVAVSVSGDDPPAAQEIDEEAIEQLFAAYATPGPHHERFRHLVGEWNAEVTTYMPDPANPEVSEGTSRFELLMGGRYLQQHFESEMHGEEFHGMAITGYDNALRKYVGTWIDDMGTGMMRTTGTLDEESGVMTETGESSSPIGTINYRMITEPKGDDEFLFTMHMAMPGAPEAKVMEITYTRKKD